MAYPKMTERAFYALRKSLAIFAGSDIEDNSVQLDDGDVMFFGTELEVLRVFAAYANIKENVRYVPLINGSFYVVIPHKVSGEFKFIGNKH